MTMRQVDKLTNIDNPHAGTEPPNLLKMMFKPVSLKLPLDLHTALKQEAAARNITLAAIFLIALTEWVEKLKDKNISLGK